MQAMAMAPYFSIRGRFFRFIKKRRTTIRRIPRVTHKTPKAKVLINKATIKKPKSKYRACNPSRYKGKINAA